MAHLITDYGPGTEEVRARIDEKQRRRTIRMGSITLLGCTTFWLATLVAILFVPWWAQILLGLFNGLAISMMFLIGHDAGHGSLFPERWMNRFAGKMCLLPSLHPYASWVYSHNRLHHAFTNIREKDPGFPPISLEEYRARSAWGRGLHRLHHTFFGLALYYFDEMWIKWIFFPSAERRPRNRLGFWQDRLLVVAFLVVWIAGLVSAAYFLEENIALVLLAGFLIPQATWNWLIAFIIIQQHTNPKVPWYSERDSPAPSFYQMQVRATPHIIFPAPIRFIMRNIMEHTAHHSDMLIPHYELSEAQKSLEKHFRRDIMRVLWSPRDLFRMLRICRIYDYVNHRWLDYDGTPLTEALIEWETKPAAEGSQTQPVT